MTILLKSLVHWGKINCYSSTPIVIAMICGPTIPWMANQLGIYRNLIKFDTQFDKKDSSYCYSSKEFFEEPTLQKNLTCGKVRYSELQNALAFDDVINTHHNNIIGGGGSVFQYSPQRKISCC